MKLRAADVWERCSRAKVQIELHGVHHDHQDNDQTFKVDMMTTGALRSELQGGHDDGQSFNVDIMMIRALRWI